MHSPHSGPGAGAGMAATKRGRVMNIVLMMVRNCMMIIVGVRGRKCDE